MQTGPSNTYNLEEGEPQDKVGAASGSTGGSNRLGITCTEHQLLLFIHNRGQRCGPNGNVHKDDRSSVHSG